VLSKRALVTGAHGFIGRQVARSLGGSGARVVGVGHGTWSRDEWRRWGIEAWHASDVTLDALATFADDPDLIVLCAGSGSVGYSIAHPHQDFQRTVETTAAALEYARLHARSARMVLLSSVGVYGAASQHPLRENDPVAPASPYGLHKHFAESMCRFHARQYGLRIAIVRLFSVYGPGLRKQLLWDACTKATHGDFTFGGTGEETRDWLHVLDAVALVEAAAAKASVDCPVVNGGCGVAPTVREVLTVLLAALGRGETPQFSGSTRAGDPAHYLADISAARSWGWAPTIAWPEGVREYARWFSAGAE
jgi:UDP-glucose 4-epimerase